MPNTLCFVQLCLLDLLSSDATAALRSLALSGGSRLSVHYAVLKALAIRGHVAYTFINYFAFPTSFALSLPLHVAMLPTLLHTSACVARILAHRALLPTACRLATTINFLSMPAPGQCSDLATRTLAYSVRPATQEHIDGKCAAAWPAGALRLQADWVYGSSAHNAGCSFLHSACNLSYTLASPSVTHFVLLHWFAHSTPACSFARDVPLSCTY